MRPDAKWSFRSRVREPNTSYSQQCTYNAAGELLIGLPSGGSPLSFHPLEDPVSHWLEDILPFCDCCIDMPQNVCALYYQRRPSNNGTGYRPPTFGWGAGDPHFKTLDGVEYTFNPVGEFWLIRQQKPNGDRFDVQARIEKYKAPPGSAQTPMNASVFTAFAIRQTVALNSILSQSNTLPPKILQIQKSLNNELQVLIDGKYFQLNPAINQSQSEGNFIIECTNVENSLHVRVVCDAGWAFEFSSTQGIIIIF